MAEIQLIPNYTSRGKTAVICEGFAYIKDKDLADEKVRYKCIHANAKTRCKGYIWLKNNSVLLQLNGNILGNEHDHIVEPDHIEAKKRMKDFKENLKVQQHTDVGILVANSRDCETAVANVMPNTNNMKRMGRRAKRKVSNCFIILDNVVIF
jgi:hypothetical protein